MIQANNPKAILTALHEFGPAPGAKAMIEWETTNAQEAIDSGIYVTFSNLTAKTECFRIGSQSMCFCGHMYGDHKMTGKLKKLVCGACACKNYKFMFRRPEEQGLYWLPRRKGFDIKKWKVTCICKHNHEAHDPNTLKCTAGCGCFAFSSDFPCIVCDKRWEEHDVLVETKDERRKMGKPVDEAYLPLARNPDIQLEYNKKVGKIPMSEEDKFNEEDAKMHGLEQGMVRLDLTPSLPPGIMGRGIDVHIQIPKAKGNIRPKQPAGRAEKSIKLMEKASGPLGGYSAANVPKAPARPEMKKEIKKTVKKEIKKEIKKMQAKK